MLMNVVSLDLSFTLIPLFFQALPENCNFQKKLLIKSGLSGQKSSLYTISIGGLSLPMCAREIPAEVSFSRCGHIAVRFPSFHLRFCSTFHGISTFLKTLKYGLCASRPPVIGSCFLLSCICTRATLSCSSLTVQAILSCLCQDNSPLKLAQPI